MKKMFVSIVITIVAFISQAQVERIVKPRINGQVDSMSNLVRNQVPDISGTSSRKNMIRDLNLTREQKLKLKEFREQRNMKKDAITIDSTLSPEQKAAQLKELKRVQARHMQSILDPEQKEKIKAMQQEMIKKKIEDRAKLNN